MPASVVSGMAAVVARVCRVRAVSRLPGTGARAAINKKPGTGPGSVSR